MLKFNANNKPDLNFKRAVKKPIPIECVQINEPFKIETMEGVLTAKKGDWLMVGVQGELYACDDAIFKQTYTIINP